MAKLNLAVQNLCFGVDVAVVTEPIGMNEVDMLVLGSRTTRFLLRSEG